MSVSCILQGQKQPDKEGLLLTDSSLSQYDQDVTNQVKETLNLDKVDNTSDLEKPVSTAQQEAIETATSSFLASLNSHINNLNNPHKVTAKQIGAIDEGSVGNLHVWQRTQVLSEAVPAVPAGYTLGEVEENVTLASRGTSVSTQGTFYYYYGDSVTVSDSGEPNAPSSDSWELIGRSVSDSTIMSGPIFVKGSKTAISTSSGKQIADLTEAATKVFFIPSGGALIVSVDTSEKMCYVIATKYQSVTGYAATPEIPARTHVDYLTSTDEEAYTEGTVDDTTIVYLGQLGEGARIEVGSYVGTGTYGANNPNTLTFGIEPKLVVVQGKNNNTGYFDSAAIVRNSTEYRSQAGSTYIFHFANIAWEEKSVSWYTDKTAPGHQANYSGTTYYYIAIG